MSQAGSNGGGGGAGTPILTINGDTGSISGSTVTIYAENSTKNCGSTVKFVNSGTVSTMNVTDVNRNTIVGDLAGTLVNTAADNTSIGTACLRSLTSGTSNVTMASGGLVALTTGSENTSVGQGGSKGITTGSFNTILAGGENLTTESNNVLIRNQGTPTQSNAIHIGEQGSGNNQQNKCFIAGIIGVTVANQQLVTINSSTGQMGVTPLTGSRVLIQSISASSSTSIDFTTGVTGYSQYEVEWFSVITTGTTTQNIQLSTNAGSTWENTNYNYSNTVAFPNSGGPQGFTGQSSIVISTVSTDSATLPWSGYAKFQNFSTALNKSCYGQSVSQFNGCLQFQHSGYWVGAGVVNGIRFIPDAGSFTSGTFNLYGIV